MPDHRLIPKKKLTRFERSVRAYTALLATDPDEALEELAGTRPWNDDQPVESALHLAARRVLKERGK